MQWWLNYAFTAYRGIYVVRIDAIQPPKCRRGIWKRRWSCIAIYLKNQKQRSLTAPRSSIGTNNVLPEDVIQIRCLWLQIGRLPFHQIQREQACVVLCLKSNGFKIRLNSFEHKFSSCLKPTNGQIAFALNILFTRLTLRRTQARNTR